ncbi:hypothetical protein G7Y79_00020g048240 [Physcia stellaris]|nr:hypothetical protein G7Y79_00020g048240 [Physcia stellaris]
MSGLEIWGALAGIVSVLQATGAAGDHLGYGSSSARALDRARTAGSAHHDASQDVFHAIHWNLECYERDVGITLDEKDRVEFTKLKESIEKNVGKAQQTASQLRYATRDRRSKKKDIEALELELGQDAILLNNLLQQLMISLHVQNFRRASSPGVDALRERNRFLAEINSGRRSSDSQSTLFRSRTDSNTSTFAPFSRSSTLEVDHEAADDTDRPQFISDSQLEKAIQRSDLDQVKAWLSVAKDDNESLSLNTTALLLACRHRCLPIVSYCLESPFSPSITDPAGLGPLHNVIGTADVSSISPSTLADITTLISLLVSNQTIDPAAPDRTAQALTPLHRAAITKNLGAVKELLKTSSKSNPSSPSSNGTSRPITRSLINIPDTQGKTALWHACKDPSRDPNLIKVLARSGGNFGDVTCPQIEGRSASAIKKLLENVEKVSSASR